MAARTKIVVFSNPICSKLQFLPGYATSKAHTKNNLMMMQKHRMEEKFRDSGEWRRKVFLGVERKVCICVGRGLKFFGKVHRSPGEAR
jgi:hypothetical protein